MRRLPVIAKFVKLVGSKRSMTVSTSASGGPISTHARHQTGSIRDTMSHPPHLLNHDVLSAVLEHAETEILLSLALCCRALYQDGVRVLLAEPVCLDQTWEDPEKKLRVV
ncbi:hypothetical protein C8Q74DRAFT_1367070 [Fomes fomentarius]|nr:hypothetical protein C8Q74DRAFT_1367070 [Fomes fomentarius]